MNEESVMSTEAKVIFEALYSKYNKIALCKKEMAKETGFSTSSLDRLRSLGLGCSYIKEKNGNIMYPLTEIAKYYSQVNQTA